MTRSDIATPTSLAPAPTLLVAGIGNIFLGDDSFGVEVINRLAERTHPSNVHVVDFGIRSLELMRALADQCDAAILIDAVRRNEAPGTLVVIEPDPGERTAEPIELDPHGLDPFNVLKAVTAIQGRCRHIVLVGCECGPAPANEMELLRMSEAVRGAVQPAVKMVEGLIPHILRELAADREPDGPFPMPLSK